ncbi:MAG: SWIM zinc finger family protein [Pseudomonadota bacterium]|jgi:uncharacterized Zn finger protein|uniref:SWIM zinc finger family protein n=1 Tax=Salinicola TaxID=404432 RepID=UPI000B3F6544|nr:SWIM zinc finger family protein [Salinicola salarius]MED5499996.1 SWIM zinc finger family protein [Pseudomonadota bacterium]
MAQHDETALLADRQLVVLAGEAAFGRGLDYYRQGMVLGWIKQGATITADVEGSERYTVTLKLSKRGLDGGCDCPASEGIDFCKHCVAVALTYRAEQAEQTRLTEGDVSDRLHAYLQQMDKVSLVEALESLIESDPVLYQKWSMRADAVLGVLDHKTLKKRITAAFPVNRDLFRFGQVHAYFAKAEPVVDQLVEQAPQLPADKALMLVNHALSRLDRALETIDDSGGFRLHCEADLQTLHVETVQRLDWSAEKLAAHLYELAFGERSERFPPIPDAYAEVLGQAGLEAYHACLQRAWDDLPNLPRNASWSERYRYLRLRDPMLKRAEAAGDLSTILALYQKTANDEKDCLDAARACIDHGGWDQVEQWLSRAAEVESKDRPRWENERQRLEIRLRLHQEDVEAAAQLQWEIYRLTQRVEDYCYLVELAEAHGLPVDYRQLAIDWLTERLGETAGPRLAWAPAPENSLLEIYLYEGRLTEAQALCAQRRVASGLLHALAQALKIPDESLPLYLRLVRSEVSKTNNQGYQQGIALLKELRDTLETPAQHEIFAEVLMQLRIDFKQKRNFIKWLNEAFSA